MPWRKQLVGGPQMRRWRNPFRVVPKRVNGHHIGYDIYVNDNKFLVSADSRFPLKRREAYAICRLLNDEVRTKKLEVPNV